MWSFVGNKGNKHLLWLALDVETREIIGVYVGERSRDGAQGLWDALPAVYRQCAVAYTDFWLAYDEVFPSKRHQSVGKESGKTSYIERFNCTLRSSSVPSREEDIIVFQEVGEPYWGNLVFCSPLQCILTYLALPTYLVSIFSPFNRLQAYRRCVGSLPTFRSYSCQVGVK